MPDNVQSFISGGTDTTWMQRADSGYPSGDAASLASGDGASNLLQLKGVQTYGLTIPEAPLVDITGDDGVIGSIRFAPQETPSGSATLGTWDGSFLSLSQGTTLYTDGKDELGVLLPDNITLRQFWVTLNHQAQSQDSGSVGDAGWFVEIFKVQMQPRGLDGRSSAEALSNSYDISAQRFDTLPWGQAVNETYFSTTGAYGLYMFKENRVALFSIVRETAVTTFTLPKVPAAANGDKVKLWNYSTGAKLTYAGSPAGEDEYSVNVSTPSITLGAAGTDGNIIVCLLEYV